MTRTEQSLDYNVYRIEGALAVDGNIASGIYLHIGNVDLAGHRAVLLQEWSMDAWSDMKNDGLPLVQRIVFEHDIAWEQRSKVNKVWGIMLDFNRDNRNHKYQVNYATASEENKI